jgi:nucleotide-binding universal stress UspA family protein
MDEFVVGLDGSDQSRLALRWAASVAERRNVPLCIFASWTYSGTAILQPSSQPLESAEDMDRRTLDDLTAVVDKELGELPPFANVAALRGPPAAALIQRVDDSSVLVLGSRGRGGFAGLMLGSVSRECIEHAPCPVVLVQHETAVGDLPGPIIVGMDGSENSERAVRAALDFREVTGRDVVAAYVWQADASEVRPRLRERLASDAKALLASWVGDHDDVGTVEIEGDPRVALVALARQTNASMIVVGRRGQSRLRGLLLGGVTNYLVTNSPTTIAVVPPPDDA